MTLNWAIHRVSLATHDLGAAAAFFGDCIGLGAPIQIDADTLAFGHRSRGFRVQKPAPAIQQTNGAVLGQATARHVAIEVSDLKSITERLDAAAISHVAAPDGDFDGAAIYTFDPAHNVIAFCQSQKAGGQEEVQPWETAWGWGIHHVNLPAADVRKAMNFYTAIIGMTEGRWRAPASRGDFSIDTSELAILPLGNFNRGLHIIRPDAGFAYRNNFAHNPSVGGHPAIVVKDVMTVKRRLETAGTLVSDAGVYAMDGMHQIYVLDPTGNVIEVNQFV